VRHQIRNNFQIAVISDNKPIMKKRAEIPV